MQCPLCINESLEVLTRGEIEIDVCPRCRGVWLDRGEIDKLAGSGSQKIVRPRSKRSGSRKKYNPDERRSDSRNYDNERRDRDNDEKRREVRKKRKKSFGERVADAFEDILD